jgi:hypothetical protein
MTVVIHYDDHTVTTLEAYTEGGFQPIHIVFLVLGLLVFGVLLFFVLRKRKDTVRESHVPDPVLSQIETETKRSASPNEMQADPTAQFFIQGNTKKLADATSFKKIVLSPTTGKVRTAEDLAPTDALLQLGYQKSTLLNADPKISYFFHPSKAATTKKNHTQFVQVGPEEVEHVSGVVVGNRVQEDTFDTDFNQVIPQRVFLEYEKGSAGRYGTGRNQIYRPISNAKLTEVERTNVRRVRFTEETKA